MPTSGAFFRPQSQMKIVFFFPPRVNTGEFFLLLTANTWVFFLPLTTKGIFLLLFPMIKCLLPIKCIQWAILPPFDHPITVYFLLKTFPFRDRWSIFVSADYWGLLSSNDSQSIFPISDSSSRGLLENSSFCTKLGHSFSSHLKNILLQMTIDTRACHDHQ